MLTHICVAYDDGKEAGWALQFGVELARRTSARLTLAHVAPADDEPVDERQRLLFELIGGSEAVRRRQRLNGVALSLGADVKAEVEVAVGPVAPTLLDLIRASRPDVLLAGTRPGRLRQLGPRLSHELMAAAPCPLVLIRSRPDRATNAAILECGSAAGRELAATLGWRLVSGRPLAGRCDRRGLVSLRAADWRYRPRLVVTDRERRCALRAAAGFSRVEAILDTARCPVLVAPGRSPQPRRRRMRSPATGVSNERPVRRSSLVLQLFAANAVVLVIATLVLIISPVSVSRNPVVAEIVVVGVGLAVMLGAHLLLLRRTLAPLRLLAEVMAAIDLRRPGRRLPEQSAASELSALADAFNAMLQRLEHERRHSARAALAAQEDERLRIAREIHDQIGQTLTALTIQAERAVHMEVVERATLEQIATTAARGLDDVRRIGRELRPEALDDLGLGNALITLCRRMGASGTVRVTHQLEPQLPALAPEAELVIYRIGQEAITNALRHADATGVHLSLATRDDAVLLEIADDGRGMPDEIEANTTGLEGMRERALLIGAVLEFASEPGAGTVVRLVVPFEEAAAR